MPRKTYPLPRLFGAVLATASLAGCSRSDLGAPTVKPVQAHVVARAEATEAGKYSVSLQAASQQAISFKVGGYVESIARRGEGREEPRLLEAGDVVRKGEALVSLRQADFRDQLVAAEGQLAQARAALERAEYEFVRASKLQASAAMTGTQFEGFRAARDAAKGAVQTATAAVSQAKQMRDDSVCASRFDGIVLQRLIQEGEFAAPGLPVIIVADLTRMRAVFGVPDSALSQFHIGDRITVRSAVLLRDFPAQVTSVSASADPRTRLFTVELAVMNAASLLKPGMVATALVPDRGSSSSSVAVSLAMVTSYSKDPGSFAVFVLEKQGARYVARERKVQVGPVSGNSLQVVDGLQAGESIVAYGIPGLRDGDAVVVTP